MVVHVFGASGQLGTELLNVLGKRGLSVTHENCELKDAVAVGNYIGDDHADVVINAAAMTDVDLCEENPSEAFAVNAIGPWLITNACKSWRKKLIHVSTDFVFGDNGPYTESYSPSPVNVYGISKLAGEQMVRAVDPGALIIRTAYLFGSTGCRGKGGGNIIDKLVERIKYGKVIADPRVIVSPTYARDLAEKLVELSYLDVEGVIHLTAGWVRLPDLVSFLAAELGLKPDIDVVVLEKFGARRPKLSYIESEREIGLAPLRPWQEAVREYLKEKHE